MKLLDCLLCDPQQHKLNVTLLHTCQFLRISCEIRNFNDTVSRQKSEISCIFSQSFTMKIMLQAKALVNGTGNICLLQNKV